MMQSWICIYLKSYSLRLGQVDNLKKYAFNVNNSKNSF